MTPADAWRERALCRTAPPGIFWSGDKQMKEAAKMYCARCPVHRQCLAEGLAFGDTGLIRGGKEL